MRELPISTTMAGVEMRLTAGGVRELHWHVEAEWAIMLNGNARITAVDQEGKSFVGDVGQGDLWLFPAGSASFDPGPGPGRLQVLAGVRRRKLRRVPHISDHGLALAYAEGRSREELQRAAQSIFDKVPKKELFIFQAGLPGDLKAEQAQAAQGTGTASQRFDFKASTMNRPR